MQNSLKIRKLWRMYEAHVLLHFILFNSQIVQFGRNLCNETNELDHKTDLNDSLTNKWRICSRLNKINSSDPRVNYSVTH